MDTDEQNMNIDTVKFHINNVTRYDMLTRYDWHCKFYDKLFSGHFKQTPGM